MSATYEEAKKYAIKRTGDKLNHSFESTLFWVSHKRNRIYWMESEQEEIQSRDYNGEKIDGIKITSKMADDEQMHRSIICSTIRNLTGRN